MIYSRLVMLAVIVLLVTYYIMIVLHQFGIIKITNKNVKFNKAVIPFYYWIVSQEKDSSKTIKNK